MINLSAFVSPWHLCQESADHVYVGLLWAVILFARFECLHLPHFTVPADTSRNQIVRVLYVIRSIQGPLHLCLHFTIRLFISTLHKLGVTLMGTVLTLWITLPAAGHSRGLTQHASRAHSSSDLPSLSPVVMLSVWDVHTILLSYVQQYEFLVLRQMTLYFEMFLLLLFLIVF